VVGGRLSFLGNWLYVNTVYQRAYKSSITNSRRFPGDIEDTLKKSRKNLRDKPYNIIMQVKFVMSIKEHVMISSKQRSSLCHPTCLLIYEQQTRGLSHVQCSKNRLMCENYIANEKIFQEHQPNSRRFPVFPRAVSNSKRFPGVPGVLDTQFSHEWSTISAIPKFNSEQPCSHVYKPPLI